MEVIFMLILYLFPIITGITIKDKLSIISLIDTSDRSVTIYGLNSKYESATQIPSDKLQQYKIDAGSSATYNVRGSSISVSKDGIVTPAFTTWYWYGNRGYTVPQSGKTADKIETKINTGVSTVTAKMGDSVFIITVTTKEYGQFYADDVINSYLNKNVTNKKTELEKL